MKFYITLFFLCTLMFGQVTQINVPYTRYVLPNGLNVLLHEDHTIPMVSVNMWYHVGSANEKVGRTGFAHLFEHLMFEGSKNVPEGKFDQWLESVGGDNNGSTSNDRTNYWENVPSNALELALFLDSDRMGFLTGSMTPETVDGQRSIVKNEKRQSYDNQPYGRAWEILAKEMYPVGHPYSWTTIGSMEDLNAATYDDVVGFFNTYYTPNNASLSIAGDINPTETIKLVEKWFGEIPAGKPVPPIDVPIAKILEEKNVVLEDKVQLPRLYMAWLTPAKYLPGDGELEVLSNIMAGGKNSRLYQKLVYEMQIAQDVAAFQDNQKLGSSFMIISTARDGHSLTEIKDAIQAEIDKLKKEPPAQRELDRAVNQFEARFLDNLEMVGGFGGKGDLLNEYYFYTGNPDYFNESISRYRAFSVNDIQTITQTYLKDNARFVLSVVPEGKKELAATNNGKEKK